MVLCTGLVITQMKLVALVSRRPIYIYISLMVSFLLQNGSNPFQTGPVLDIRFPAIMRSELLLGRQTAFSHISLQCDQ